MGFLRLWPNGPFLSNHVEITIRNTENVDASGALQGPGSDPEPFITSIDASAYPEPLKDDGTEFGRYIREQKWWLKK